MSSPLITLRNATCGYGARDILTDVDLEIRAGEAVALLGSNGAGKSTLLKAITGLAALRGMATIDASLGYVPQYQDSDLSFPVTAYKVVEMGLLPSVSWWHRCTSMRSYRDCVLNALRQVGMEHLAETRFGQLSGGQRQRVLIALALSQNPDVLICDEPTTALDVTTQIEVLRAFKSVMKAGAMAGVYVSHDLAVVAQVADRIVVLKGGEVQEIGATEQILHAPAHPYTRELLAAFEPATAARPAEPATTTRAPVLQVSHVVAGYGPTGKDGMPHKLVLRDVGFQLHRGCNMGVIGESGSGKSTLARAIAGLLPPASGKVYLDGGLLEPASSARSKEELRRLQIVFQLADTALNPQRSIGDIIGRPLTFYHGLKGAAKQARIAELLDMVHLPRAMMHRLPGELSGGQKQRANLARALAANPDVILCDEVTSALDTVVAAAVIELLKELQRELDLSYVFISHDLSTVQAICDEVMVMSQGEVVETLRAADLPDGARHPYSKLLFSSVPQLDTGWLDSVPLRSAG